ncbi:MAG: hypothetical protein WC728_05480 [Elusimicrobiota bacterium]
MSEDPRARCWEQGWDGHERNQRLRAARLTLAQKLAWLEQAHDVARRLGRPPGGASCRSNVPPGST